MKKFISILLAIVSLFSLTIPAFAEYNSTMYVNIEPGQTVRLRSTRDTSVDNNILVNVPHGTEVKADKYNNTWHKVKYTTAAGKVYKGYMLTKYLTETKPNTGSGSDSGSGSSSNDWEGRYGTTTYKNGKTTGFYQGLRNVQIDLMHYHKYHQIYRPDDKQSGLYGDISGKVCMSKFKADGYMGNKTETAIHSFQQCECIAGVSLAMDGVCGPATKAELYKFYLWTVSTNRYEGISIENYFANK